MKKTYTKPEIDITAFTTEDIMTISSNNGLSDSVGGGINVDLGDESSWTS